MNLTTQDISMLIEAVEAWERMPLVDASMTGLLGAMLSPSQSSAKASVDRMTQKIANDKPAAKIRAERAILIKAKLIMLKQSATADEISEQASADAQGK